MEIFKKKQASLKSMSKYCPLCKSSEIDFFATGWDSEYHTSDEIFDYYFCPRCQTVFLWDPPIERLREIYPDNYYSFSNDVDRSWPQRIKKFLEVRMLRRLTGNLFGKRLSALDVGGGNGWILNTLKKADSRFEETHVTDIDGSARLQAEASGHIYHCARIEDFVADKKFDFIFLFNLLEHVADPLELLKKLRGMLSDQGLILVKTPNIDTLDRYLFQKYNWGGLHCPRHWVLFNKAGLLSLVKKSGLGVLSFSYTQGAHQWAASILGWLVDRGWISITRKRPIHCHFLYVPVIVLFAAFDFMRSLFYFPTAQIFVVLRLPR